MFVSVCAVGKGVVLRLGENMQNPTECLIIKNGKPLTYDEIRKRLYLAEKGFTVFASKRAARSALYHTVEAEKAEGIPEPHKQYEVVET